MDSALDWIGLIGGVIGGLYAIVQMSISAISAWRNRGRLELVRSKVYYYTRRYHAFDLESAGYKYGHIRPYSAKEKEQMSGTVCRSFTVIIFEVMNNYSYQISVENIKIDDWIYSDHWEVPMYSRQRNYRAYDLHTKERVDLSSSVPLKPKETLGRRIEIHEKADSVDAISNHMYTTVTEHQYFNLSLEYSRGKSEFVLEIDKELDAGSFTGIKRWSNKELFTEAEVVSGSMPLPDGEKV